MRPEFFWVGQTIVPDFMALLVYMMWPVRLGLAQHPLHLSPLSTLEREREKKCWTSSGPAGWPWWWMSHIYPSSLSIAHGVAFSYLEGTKRNVFPLCGRHDRRWVFSLVGLRTCHVTEILESLSDCLPPTVHGQWTCRDKETLSVCLLSALVI